MGDCTANVRGLHLTPDSLRSAEKATTATAHQSRSSFDCMRSLVRSISTDSIIPEE